MLNDSINIVFSVDNNFVPQLATTIVSILLNANTEDEFNFYVLDGGISARHKDKIDLLKTLHDFNIQYIKIQDEVFKDCPINLHFTKATYYRFKLASLLNLDKVLYLDCDILVKKSLRDLYNVDIKNKYAAIVEDYLSSYKLISTHCKILGINKYFNAGVMLLNLKKIREDSIEQKCFTFVKNFPEKIKFVDQCVLNAVFQENVEFIDKIYNFQYNKKAINDIPKIYKTCKNKCVILHFVSELKPWILEQNYHFKWEYNKYLSKTPYKRNLLIVIFGPKFSVFEVFIRKIKNSVRYVFNYMNNI